MIFCTLNSLMTKHNVNQSKIADKTGINRPTLLQLIRNDNQSIKYETIDKLCDFFGVKIEDLLIRTDYDIEISNIETNYNPVDSDISDDEIIHIFNVCLEFKIGNMLLSFKGDIFDTEYNIQDYKNDGLNLNCYLEKKDYEKLPNNLEYVLNLYVENFNVKNKVFKKYDFLEDEVSGLNLKIIKYDDNELSKKLNEFIESLNSNQKEQFKDILANNHTDK